MNEVIGYAKIIDDKCKRGEIIALTTWGERIVFNSYQEWRAFDGYECANCQATHDWLAWYPCGEGKE